MPVTLELIQLFIQLSVKSQKLCQLVKGLYQAFITIPSPSNNVG